MERGVIPILSPRNPTCPFLGLPGAKATHVCLKSLVNRFSLFVYLLVEGTIEFEGSTHGAK